MLNILGSSFVDTLNGYRIISKHMDPKSSEINPSSKIVKPRSMDRVRDFFVEHGMAIEIKEFPVGTRTAQQAANAVGVPLGSIVKSLVFLADGQVVLALVSGDQRADAMKIAHLVGASEARIAKAEEVREQTGYAIGGVPPIAHDGHLETLIDEILLRFQTVWAAAGTPNAVFEIETEKLLELTQGRVENIVVD